MIIIPGSRGWSVGHYQSIHVIQSSLADIFFVCIKLASLHACLNEVDFSLSFWTSEERGNGKERECQYLFSGFQFGLTVSLFTTPLSFYAVPTVNSFPLPLPLPPIYLAISYKFRKKIERKKRRYCDRFLLLALVVVFSLFCCWERGGV